MLASIYSLVVIDLFVRSYGLLDTYVFGVIIRLIINFILAEALIKDDEGCFA